MKKITIAALAVLCLCLPAQADDKKGKLGHLSKYIGTDQIERVIDDPAVRRSLAEVMPAAEIETVKKNLQVRSSIDFIEGNLVMNGNAPHAGDTDTVSVWLSVYSGKARVALQSGGRMTLYAKDGEYKYLPMVLRAQIALTKETSPFERPPAFLNWTK